MGFHAQFMLEEIDRMEKKMARGCDVECDCSDCIRDIDEIMARDLMAMVVAFGITSALFIIGAILLINT